MTSILKTDEIQSQNGGAVVKMQTLKHPSSGSNNLVLDSDGNVSITNEITSGTFNGTVGSSTTITSGINMPDFDLNLSSGQNRIISFGSKGVHIYGVVDSTGTGNSSAQTGIYSESSSSGSLKVRHLTGYVGKTGLRNDIGRVRSWGNNMYVLDRANGYLQGASVNDIGLGTLTPSTSRWSLQFNGSEDYELQFASLDGGTFYYSLFGFKV